jgi:hypothetical protein
MKYNTKVTLSENLINNKTFVSNGSLLTEQPLKTFLMSLFGTADELAIASLKTAKNAKYLQAVKFLDDAAIYSQAGFKNVDDLVTAMAKGTLKSSQISALAKGLLKKGTITGPLRKALTDKAAKLSFKNFPNKSGQKIKNELIKKGYDPSIADEIAVKIANKNLPKNIPVKPTDIDDVIANIPKTPVKERTTWQAIKRWGLGASLTIGTIALLYSYFNDDIKDVVVTEEDPVPPVPVPPVPGTNRYRTDCDKLGVYTKGCKSETIKSVQTCLGLVPDGKFWVKTQAALEAKGFPNGFVREDVPKICGNQTPPPPQPEDEYEDAEGQEADNMIDN